MDSFTCLLQIPTEGIFLAPVTVILTHYELKKTKCVNSFHQPTSPAYTWKAVVQPLRNAAFPTFTLRCVSRAFARNPDPRQLVAFSKIPRYAYGFLHSRCSKRLFPVTAHVYDFYLCTHYLSLSLSPQLAQSRRPLRMFPAWNAAFVLDVHRARPISKSIYTHRTTLYRPAHSRLRANVSAAPGPRGSRRSSKRFAPLASYRRDAVCPLLACRSRRRSGRSFLHRKNFA